MKTPSAVLPVTLFSDIEIIAPPLALSPVEFCVITLFATRIVPVALACSAVVANETMMFWALTMLFSPLVAIPVVL